MRIATFLISAAYAILLGWAWVATASNSGMDAAGRGMAMGFLVVGIGFSALFAIPALILAAMDKVPKWALGLALVPAAAAVLVSVAGIV